MSKDAKPPASDKDSAHRTEQKRLYRQRYWERFQKTRKRVYGTLTSEEYAEIELRAEEAGRAVWTQIHAEAKAYAKGEFLPSKDLDEQIMELIVQLRRIGNNVNQITREFNTTGNLDQPDFVRRLAEMETLIKDFVKKPS